MSLGRRTLVRMSLLVGVAVYTAACGSHQSPGSQTSEAGVARVIRPKSLGGSPGTGPLVVPAPTKTPGGKPGTQEVVLGDRTLTVNHVSEQAGPDPKSAFVDVTMTLQNNGDPGIVNQSTAYELIGPDGDIFGYRSPDSGPFFGTVAGHAIRNGVVEFEVPKAATSGLSLIYRPGPKAQPAILTLKVE
jgi:hypothetical protein